MTTINEKGAYCAPSAREIGIAVRKVMCQSNPLGVNNLFNDGETEEEW